MLLISPFFHTAISPAIDYFFMIFFSYADIFDILFRRRFSPCH